MINVLTAKGCGGCERAKMLLSMAEVEYRTFDIAETHQTEVVQMKAFMEDNGLRSLPQIFNGAEYIGTDRDITRWIKEHV